MPRHGGLAIPSSQMQCPARHRVSDAYEAAFSNQDATHSHSGVAPGEICRSDAMTLERENEPGRGCMAEIAAPAFPTCAPNNRIVSRFRVLGHWPWLILSHYIRPVGQTRLRVSLPNITRFPFRSIAECSIAASMTFNDELNGLLRRGSQ
jgi:hypothetical protein